MADFVATVADDTPKIATTFINFLILLVLIITLMLTVSS